MKELYKRDSAGKTRVWGMLQDGNKHQTHSGILGGTMTASDWTVCIGKQKRTDEEQAAFEVNAGYVHQLKREYFETIEEIDAPRFFKPMLAQKWGECGWDKAAKIIDKQRVSAHTMEGTGVYHQPKLDGFRCIAQKSGLTTREGQPIVSVPHIEAALAPFFAQFPEAVLDGELYNHTLKNDFEELSSILKKQKNISSDDLAKSAALAQYHVYDYPSPDLVNLPFSERSGILMQDLPDNSSVIQLVITVPVLDEAHRKALQDHALEQEYEGQILRLDIPYEQKRSFGVLKNKVFDDDEFELVPNGITEGIGNYAGYAKSAEFWLPDKSGTFSAGIKGGKKPELEMKTFLANNYRSATVQYFGMTAYGKPRMATTQRWHGQEGRI